MAHPASPVASYHALSRWLHWATALLVLATIPVGVIMLTDGLSRPVQNTLFIFHKNVGVILFVMVVARLIVRAVTAAPAHPEGMPAWQQRAASLSHAALYVLLLVMAVSGYVRVAAGGFPIEMLDAIGAPSLVPRSDPLAETAKAIHANVRYLLAAFILLHIGAALHHGLIKRDGIFRRIWRPNPSRP